ncbi:helix-turn-helix transcriptional regulator [Sphingobium xenophagum]|uniref:helix-turn-helix transcriptional regulator n=1 Tax=Sphingobium xenophagum TaxID=121428 RepID=UPI00241D8E80|nr:helix-turn-helix domain-containing protein [Sphingobium xenophagum]
MDIDHKTWQSADEWLTTVQLAALTKTSRSLWDKMRVRGDGPAWSRCGNRPRYRRADVEAWLLARTIRNTSQRAVS